MPEWGTLSLFLLAALVLIVTPGPAVLYVVARSISQGRGAGFASVLGVGTGNLLHVVAAVVGVSALVASSATAFAVVTYLGAAYLIYLGVRTLATRSHAEAVVIQPSRSLPRTFLQGTIVAVLNPKTALFFLAFLPQFVDPARGSPTLQTLVLGVILVTIGLLSDSIYVLIAGAAGNLLRRSAIFPRIQRVFSGSVYLGLGITTALTGSSRD
jgi:threonine/homoserine/homoserine lactone efflux protein